MIARQLLDLRLLIFRHAGNDQVLVSGNAEFAFVDLRNFQQTGFQRTPRIIQNTAVFNKQRQVPFIVDTLSPSRCDRRDR
jgi:tRNA A37 threonylcarbamoyladenosine modification protein TsaB